jgi:hypothetical protein
MATKQKTQKESTALATQAEQAIAEVFGGADIYQFPTDAPLPRALILRESSQFEMPGGELTKGFEGHIVYWHEANTYWSNPFGEGGSSFPDCCSSNGAFPDGGDNRQDDNCSQCGWNQYASDFGGGRGKRCQNMILLYVVRDTDRLPVVLKAPASSLGKRESLIPWLTNAVNEGYAGKYQTIRVRFGLYRKEFDRYPASILKLETVRVLDPSVPDDKAQLDRLARLFGEVQRYCRQRGADDVAQTERDPQVADANPL